LMVVQLNHIMLQCLLLASPIMIAMLLAELGLALVSRFAPQLQVFFLAMPVKSALGLFVLIVYAATLLDFGLQPLREIGSWTERLDPLWRTGGAP
jgi:type III secretion protein T